MKAALKLVTAPAASLSLTELKEFLHVDGNAEDATLSSLIAAATDLAESYMGFKLLEQVWQVWLDGFPQSQRRSADQEWTGTQEGHFGTLFGGTDSLLELPIGPCRSLEKLETFGDDGVPVESLVSDYIVDLVSSKMRVALKSGGSWPSSSLRAFNSICLTVKVGRYDSAAAIPKGIVECIKGTCAHLYENRGDQQKLEIPPALIYLLSPYREVQFGLR